MFEIVNNNKFPIKVWLSGEDELEPNCLRQAQELAKLPFLHKGVCLMPDCHAGKGMPVGGVIAAKNAILPSAVGTDIGCGMAFVSTNIQVDSLEGIATGNGTIIQSIIGTVMREIPVGREQHKKAQKSVTIAQAFKNPVLYESETKLIKLLDESCYQMGTLGGGNHFIELQADSDGYLCIMIHSGSRHLGAGICEYFHQTARDLSTGISYLQAETAEGIQYIVWMELAMDYARESRAYMMKIVCDCAKSKIEKFTGQQVNFDSIIDCPHNYASLETHYGEKVWVHRKGAIRVCKGDLAVIPGAMGSYSYVVQGKGCRESFQSASHGAGRRYSRTRASELFTVEQVLIDLKKRGIILGKRKKSDVTEECCLAYKDIDEVLAQERDLVTPIRKLRTVGVIKG